MMAAVPQKKGLTDEEMVLVARFRMMSPGTRQLLVRGMSNTRAREEYEATLRAPVLLLIPRKRGAQ